MQLSPMIRANLLAPILEALSAQGHDTAPLLRRHALPFAHPIDPYQLIPLASYVALFEQAVELREIGKRPVSAGGRVIEHSGHGRRVAARPLLCQRSPNKSGHVLRQ